MIRFLLALSLLSSCTPSGYLATEEAIGRTIDELEEQEELNDN